MRTQTYQLPFKHLLLHGGMSKRAAPGAGKPSQPVAELLPSDDSELEAPELELDSSDEEWDSEAEAGSGSEDEGPGGKGGEAADQEIEDAVLDYMAAVRTRAARGGGSAGSSGAEEEGEGGSSSGEEDDEEGEAGPSRCASAAPVFQCAAANVVLPASFTVQQGRGVNPL